MRLNDTSFQPIHRGQLNDTPAADKVFRLSCLSHSCEMVSPFSRSNEHTPAPLPRFLSGLVLKGKCTGVGLAQGKSTRKENPHALADSYYSTTEHLVQSL